MFIIAIASYLIGSIPTAVIISKQFFGFDIREQGSGNMGSTNAFRVLGWKWGAFVQVVDILKGLVAVTLIAHLMQDQQLPFTNRTPFADFTVVRILAGSCAVVGHIFSVFVGFKGGKGVNTAAGMLIGIAPIEVGIAFAAFAIAVTLSGYISLGSICAAIMIPGAMAIRYNIFDVNIYGYHTLIWFSICVSLLVIYMHRANIRRLLAGTENRFTNLQIFKTKEPDN
ncbi:MAG: glycerol-3-phosphate 1-O-acyltransferase PlsY [Candidatus Kapabacteria bacterium]|nr:glycerol-3-phosphate 1-O-acyltransferase PlsY [Candidatus Kapabacteria bacterium]